MKPAVSFSNICKHYGSFRALDGVSFDIHPGDFFALLGPNGAGKTTLISLLAGLNRMESGSIRINGFDVSQDYRQARREIGVVPQELVFDPFFTVRETLTLQSGYFGLRRNQRWIDELLHKLGLSEKADTNMRGLSGGMKRRVLVAQALVHRPPVIVLDEPTAGVDVELRQSLWQFIRQLNGEGHTVLLTTHYLEEAENLCNRIAFLKQGRLLALEDKHQLLSRGGARQLFVTLAAGQCLPDSVAAMAHPLPAGQWRFDLSSIGAVEDVLAQLHAQGVRCQDIEIGKPDLEQVFIDMMAREECA